MLCIRTAFTALACVVVLSGLSAGSACRAAADSYLDHVSDALDALERGQTQQSLASLKQAIDVEANDSLAHVALGYTLLCASRASDAAAEFSLASELGDVSALADYGRGLVYLSKADFGEAISLICQAQAARPELDMQATIEYAKALGSGSYVRIADDRGDESLMAMNAAALMKQQRTDEAASIWKRLRETASRPGLGERIGCSMTFVRSSPVALTGWPINEPYSSMSVDRSKLAVVSGSVILKADLSKMGSVEVVSFFVDNRFVGMTNHSPFIYTWDTTQATNGVHSVKIQAFANGYISSEKTMQVLVRNDAPKASPEPMTDAEKKLWERLWEAMRLKPSAAAINYNLALCAFESGGDTAAAADLERVMAADPDYPGAAERLSRIYAADGGYERVFEVDTDRKAIALTFDDGPKELTAKLLDLLGKKGVKATFFVVGKQAEAYPDLVKRMDSEGHDIQNHTYGHRALEYLSEREIQQEIFRTCAVVRSLTGKRTRFVRPPGGREGKKLPEVMKKFGMISTFWTVNCGNLEGTSHERLVDYVVSAAKPGAIVLMHNVELVTLDALPDIIDRLRGDGYELVTLSELVKYEL